VQTALQNLASIGPGNALVSGPSGGPWLVRFANGPTNPKGEQALPDMTGSGSGLTCSPACTLSVVTQARGGDSGRVQKQIDPLGLIAKADYDLMGRTARVIEAFAAFAPSNANDRTTEYTYDGDSNLLTYSAVLPNNVRQTTQYTYGISGTVINSNDLLASVTYPGQSQTESYTYNAQADVATLSDRNGSQHSFTYDVLGRRTKDAITTLGTNVDPAVQRLETAYDTGGRAYLFSSYSASSGGTLVNQVQRAFNGLGQLTNEYQSHSGAVVVGTTPQVQYTYSQMLDSQGHYANHSRLTSMTYPNTSPARTLTYNYNGTTLDDSISRLTSITDGTPTLENYTYLGLNTVVKRGHPEPGVDLSYINQPSGSTDGGDQYTGLDRFGRVIDQYWVKAGTATDRFQYTYDQDSNRLTRTNAVNTNFNESYSYDNFNQLTNFTRGSHSQTWSTLDPLGNWGSSFSDVTNSVTSTQNRGNDTQNKITSLTGTNLFASWVAPTYDNNGNTVTDQLGSTLTYDGWNRLARYSGSSSVSYAYDALGRRVSETRGANVTDLYYSAAWQVVEERTGSNVTQYVWSPVYVDALIERDSGGQRLYVQQDANWNVTALVDSTGVVQERYVYDPYGTPTKLKADWTAQTTSLFSWAYLHQGGRLDSTSGLYNFRMRDYSPTLGRWMAQDPIHYLTGDSDLYRFVGNSPTTYVDPAGLSKFWLIDHPWTIPAEMWKNTIDWLWGGENDRRSPIAKDFDPDRTDQPIPIAGNSVSRDAARWGDKASQDLVTTFADTGTQVVANVTLLNILRRRLITLEDKRALLRTQILEYERQGNPQKVEKLREWAGDVTKEIKETLDSIKQCEKKKPR
jgi:RHS repeat-associated protein